jgi:hypothetical protein
MSSKGEYIKEDKCITGFNVVTVLVVLDVHERDADVVLDGLENTEDPSGEAQNMANGFFPVVLTMFPTCFVGLRAAEDRSENIKRNI